MLAQPVLNIVVPLVFQKCFQRSLRWLYFVIKMSHIKYYSWNLIPLSKVCRGHPRCFIKLKENKIVSSFSQTHNIYSIIAS